MADPAVLAKRKRTKTSPAWQYFEESQQGKVRCTLCHPDLYELAYSSSTSNLLYHLKTKHTREYRQLDEDPARPTTSDSSTRTRSSSTGQQSRITEFSPIPGEKKKQLDRQCLLWLCSSMRPFLVVDDPGLRDWVSMISSGRYVPPSRKTLMSMTPDLFLAVEDMVWKIVREQIPQMDGLWITVDGWTSRAGYSYLGIIIHYLSMDFTPASFLLSAVQCNDHDAETVAAEIKAVLETWELGRNITSGMVGDNTNSVPATARQIAQDPDYEEFEYWGCVAHLINLVVRHSLSLSRPALLLSKCRNIVTYIHKSAQALEQLHAYEAEMKIPKLGVVQDVETRWSSTFSMLSRLVLIKAPLIKTLKTMQKRDLVLNSNDWDNIAELLTALEPFSLLTVV